MDSLGHDEVVRRGKLGDRVRTGVAGVWVISAGRRGFPRDEIAEIRPD